MTQIIEPGLGHPDPHPADSPEEFIAAGLSAFALVGRSVLALTAGCGLIDAAAVVWDEPGAPWAGPAAAAGGAGLVGAALVTLASLQVRYTFEHGHTRKRHFYALKQARRREACAALRSLNPADAVGAVRLLGELRRDTGGLDRRLIVESLILRRRWRDLTWFPAAFAVAALAAAGAGVLGRAEALQEPAAPAALLGASVVLWGLVELWARERVRRVLELLAPAPADLARSFDPTPELEAVIESLLARLNRHFDRLNGFADRAGEPAEA
jgi:hypothetical protein